MEGSRPGVSPFPETHVTYGFERVFLLRTSGSPSPE